MRSLLLGLALAASACTISGTATTCLVDADCASGACQPDGTCATSDGGTPDGDGGANDADGGTDGGTAETDGGANPLSCANGDGKIERRELVFQTGLSANFRVASNARVDVAGTNNDWDFSGMLPGDEDVRVTLAGPSGYWFSNDFPGATYVAPLGGGTDLVGVFRATSDALELMGVASPQSTGAYTNLKYEPPAKVLAFPLQQGAKWKTSSTVTGFYQGVYSVLTETYDSTVDARGTVRTPYGSFPAMRVRSNMTRGVGLGFTSHRQVLFVAECFGTVVAATSTEYETKDDFTLAAEVRRLAP